MEEEHRYLLPDGRELQGITPLLARRLFPAKYDGVPPDVMERAAVRGTRIHLELQLYDELGEVPDSSEAWAYAGELERQGLRHEESEYTVTDGERWASRVDKVYRGGAEGGWVLADVKTTYRLDEAYVSWQLSVYAWLFCLQNPGARVERLLAVHVRGSSCRFVEVPRRRDEEVKALLYGSDEELAAATGSPVPGSPVPAVGEEGGEPVPESCRYLASELVATERRMHELSLRRDELLVAISEAMERTGARRWLSEGATLTYVPAATGERTDTRALVRDHPELAARYLRPAERKAYVRVKLNDGTQDN